MYWTLGNSKEPVLGPVPNLGPVLILGPWDRSRPDQLQTLPMKNMLVVTWYVVKHHIESEVWAFPSPHFKYCQLNIYQLIVFSLLSERARDEAVKGRELLLKAVSLLNNFNGMLNVLPMAIAQLTEPSELVSFTERLLRAGAKRKVSIAVGGKVSSNRNNNLLCIQN